jgi:hypothetical protein
VQTTALGAVAAHGHLEAVRLLLDKGAELDIAGSNGLTPLMAAAATGQLEVVRLLLARGAAVDAADVHEGMSAFHCTCLHGEPDCAEALVRAGCNVSACSTDGLTGRQLAESQGHAAVLARLRTLDAEQPSGRAASPPAGKKRRKKRPKKKPAGGAPATASEAAAGPRPEPGPGTEPDLNPDPELEPDPEPEMEAPPGLMAEFDEAAVLAWLATVPGLTVGQRAAAAEMMAEDEYNGPQLAGVTAKALGRLLRGTEAEGAVPLLLAARDERLALPEPEPEPEPPSGPMAEFDEAAVLAWLATVPGLTAAQLVAAAEMLVEDEYEGADLVTATAKTLRRLLKGSAAEGAVPLLLAARDARLAAEEADPDPAVALGEELTTPHPPGPKPRGHATGVSDDASDAPPPHPEQDRWIAEQDEEEIILFSPAQGPVDRSTSYGISV